MHEALYLRNEWYNNLLQKHLIVLCDHENAQTNLLYISCEWHCGNV